jgi:hypothetical protein
MPINKITVFHATVSGWNESFAELTQDCGKMKLWKVTSHGSKMFLKFLPTTTGSEKAVWLVFRLTGMMR